MPLVLERLAKVADARLNSVTKSVREAAGTPALFTQIRQPDTNYLVVPRVSSELRRYFPIGFLPPDVIVSDAVYVISDATLYHFGVLTSSVHMAWLKIVCGRLEMRHRYAPAVYNNFPWSAPTAKQKAAIEVTAQNILDVRAGFADSTLADLYNELTMPQVLRDAHCENDRALLAAYGFSPTMSESDVVVVDGIEQPISVIEAAVVNEKTDTSRRRVSHVISRVMIKSQISWEKFFKLTGNAG